MRGQGSLELALEEKKEFEIFYTPGSDMHDRFHEYGLIDRYLSLPAQSYLAFCNVHVLPVCLGHPYL